jgi:NitT/TauT family transport system substrate-binding protein
MSKHAIIGAIAACMLLPASAALAQGKGEIVRIQDYPGSGNMLYRIAIAKGFCEKHGIKCQLQMIPAAPLGTQALLAKSIDVAFIPIEVQINAMLRGAVVKAFAGGAPPNPFLLTVRNDLVTANSEKGFPSFMTDLKGKKIGVTSRGAAPELVMTFLARKVGLRAEDFTFVSVGSPNTAYPSLISKQVDAAMSFEPLGAMCEVLKTCKVIYRVSDDKEPIELFATNGGSIVHVATQDYINKNPHVIEALTDAERDADAFLRGSANFDEAVKIMMHFFKLDMPQGDEIMIRSIRDFSGYGASISRPAVKAIADYMFATKQLDAPFDTTRLILASAP